MSDHVIIKKEDILSDKHFILKNYEFDLKKKDGRWETQKREVYDHGNGATVFLYNKQRGTVILTRQFRMATFVNGNKDGYMVETCAGLLDENEPEVAVKKEIKEETGYEVDEVKKVFEAYMTPGADTEKLHFFIAEYTKGDKVDEGGGLEEEQEEIDVLEMSFDEAYGMIVRGEIQDAKTILLFQYAKINNLV